MIKDAVVKTLAGDSRNVTVCYSVCHGCEETLSKVIVSLSDITERKRSEAALQAMRAEMEQLMRFHVASQTVSALAHELNQPLNAVTSYAEAALRLLRAGNPQPERLLHAIESSTQQAQRAGQVVRELLAFMKQGEVQTEPVDLNDLVRQVLDRIDADGYGGFQTRLELEPGLAPVTANRLQLEKVLVNLIENGVEAMRDAGISIHAITITVRTNPEGPMAQVTVHDSGPGIDPQTLHRIFDPFFTTKPKGLGMGLAISRAIIELHGGQLWVESEPGSGASFHFTLPFAP
jgi:signal transduction histidine kinase